MLYLVLEIFFNTRYVGTYVHMWITLWIIEHILIKFLEHLINMLINNSSMLQSVIEKHIIFRETDKGGCAYFAC